jgi:hypothetical protein
MGIDIVHPQCGLSGFVLHPPEQVVASAVQLALGEASVQLAPAIDERVQQASNLGCQAPRRLLHQAFSSEGVAPTEDYRARSDSGCSGADWSSTLLVIVVKSEASAHLLMVSLGGELVPAVGSKVRESVLLDGSNPRRRRQEAVLPPKLLPPNPSISSLATFLDFPKS